MNESLNRFHQLLLDKGIAFVRYSLPNAAKAITLISYNPVSFKDLNYLADNQDEGFVFAPFVVDEKFPIWFLKVDKIIDATTDFLEIEKDLENLPDINRKAIQDTEPTSKSDYSKAFDVFLKALELETLNKAILSRVVTKDRTKEPLFNMYTRLMESYPTAFTYLIHLPSGEIWMGATPELLLQQDEKGIQTMALAGTQVLNNRHLDEVVWENKEIEEQAYVRRYVQNILTSIAEMVRVSDTYSTGAANLVHLRTDFNVYQAFDSSKVIEIAKNIHPTPAVCGIPLMESKALILKTEKHSRAYYTGFLGPVNTKSMALFVNLRCMQVFPEKYALYVGGGITCDSEMEKEWKETEAKAQTLLSVIESK